MTSAHHYRMGRATLRAARRLTSGLGAASLARDTPSATETTGGFT